MKALDRLIIKAKNKCGYEQLINGFISPSETQPGKWIARGDIWNGKKYGSVKAIICGEYDSTEEAYEALCRLGEQYPTNKDIPIILDNVME